MKKIIVPVIAALFLIACGSGDGDKKDTTETKETTTTDITKNPDYEKGVALIAGSDCLTCHRVDEMLTGPSYRDVANKYAGTSDTAVSYLASKIIQGGNGVWGEIYMTPHADMSREDAEAMAKYILLLKNN